MHSQNIFVESGFKGLDMKHLVRVLGFGWFKCLFVSFTFLHKTMKLELLFALPQGRTLLF